jgi:hypothetical protein
VTFERLTVFGRLTKHGQSLELDLAFASFQPLPSLESTAVKQLLKTIA